MTDAMFSTDEDRIAFWYRHSRAEFCLSMMDDGGAYGGTFKYWAHEAAEAELLSYAHLCPLHVKTRWDVLVRALSLYQKAGDAAGEAKVRQMIAEIPRFQGSRRLKQLVSPNLRR